jgi:desulfoferrodoxin (superoxide reductase-like protein)
MIYFFRAISNESDDFLFDIAINSDAKFVDLHHFIQKQLNFDPAQMTSFFLTDEDWQKEKEITLIDMMMDDDSAEVMDKVSLGELLNEPKQRLLYAFDLFAERVLFMELTDITEGSVKETIAVRIEGTPPPQFSEEGFSFDLDLASDVYDEDEMDDFLSFGDDLPEDYADEDDGMNDFY